jgi:hypothetical protein
MPTAGLFRVLLHDGARGPMVRTTARGGGEHRYSGCRMPHGPFIRACAVISPLPLFLANYQHNQNLVPPTMSVCPIMPLRGPFDAWMRIPKALDGVGVVRRCAEEFWWRAP